MGGTRFVGVIAVRRLLDAGHDVTVFHRGSREPDWIGSVRSVVGDRNNADDLTRLATEHFDTVLDLSAYTGDQTASLLAALPDVERWVHCSTVNVVRPDPVIPWTEDIDYGPHPLWGRYAVDKIACERAISSVRTDAHSVVVRLPLVLGPRNFIPREEFVLNRILDGAQILLPGDGQAVHQYIYRDHAAEALARAVELPGHGFDVYNVASKRCNTSLQGFVDVCAEIVGRSADTRAVGGGPTGEDRDTFDNADCVFPFSNENTILAIDKAERAGLVAPYLDLREMISTAYEALLDDPERRAWQRTDAEERVLSRLKTAGARP
ncbi:mRNA-binding protein [Rhodococcoides trifolii]|uniref:UDP-glucose 4-epimerase n=1 Tax=Rhodococcoides trifolii TaxID=908250 RepID=A0A917G7W9_9NOCA|nr:NAD-dependent epimerase/dehydratase family protein [Rhodococcus trifolii]GGG27273.1 mRNA-binding protein [Rhodococcus trifolii]